MMSEPGLLPCPCCPDGGKPAAYKIGELGMMLNHLSARCDACGLTAPSIKVWNTRRTEMERHEIAPSTKGLGVSECRKCGKVWHSHGLGVLMTEEEIGLKCSGVPLPTEITLDELHNVMEAHYSSTAARQALRDKWPNGVRFKP